MMGERVINMQAGSTYIENQTNYVRGNQYMGEPVREGTVHEEVVHEGVVHEGVVHEGVPMCAIRRQMELLVQNHADPSAFVDQLKRDVSACDKPKEKMRVVVRNINAGYLPEDLPFTVFDKEIGGVTQRTFSYWITKGIE